MNRLIISDAQWLKIEPLCLGRPCDPGRTGGDCRLFLEAVLWIARTGSPWRDLPVSFGNWNSVFKRYRDWIKAGVFLKIFEVLSGDADMEYAMVDGTIVKVHRHGQGAKGGPKIKRSANPKEDGPRKSSPWSMRSATSSGSSCCQGSAGKQPASPN